MPEISQNDLDYFHKQIARLERRIVNLENNTAPTIPVYDGVTPNFPQDAVEGQIALSPDKTAWAYTEADGWWNMCTGMRNYGTFENAVLSIPDLVGYWRMGEAAAPLLDSGGFPNGPYNLSYGSGPPAPTYQVPGLINAAQDDGAIMFNGAGFVSAGAFGISTADPVMDGLMNHMTIAAWCNPIANASANRGGIAANNGIVAGSPSHEEGWSLDCVWSGGGGGITTVRFVRASGGTLLFPSQVVTAGVGCFVVGTYDGSNIRLYVNGVGVGEVADTRVFGSGSGIGIGACAQYDFVHGANPAPFYGVIDEVALWQAPLGDDEIFALYNAGKP